jgi:acyl-CoA synthetase (AMP-forming)/AMP-acid ligase II
VRLEAGDVIRTLADVLEQSAAEAPSSFLEVIEGDAPRHLPLVLENATRWAGRLRELGVRSGDRVAILMESRVRAVEALFGAWMLRAAVVPLAGPRGLIAGHRALERISAALRASGAAVVLAGPKVLARIPTDAFAALGVIAASLDDPGTAASGPARGDPTDLALVQYTSGSTGSPRGAALTHANLMANLGASVKALGLTPDDRCISWLPLYHDMGLIGAVLTAIFRGGSSILIAPEAFVLRPTTWLETFTSRRGTYSPAPNFGYQLCVTRVPDQALKRLDLRSWRLALTGAEPVRLETIEAFTTRFAPCGFRADAILPVYGLAESTLAAAFPPLGRGARVEVVDGEILRSTGRVERGRPEAGRTVVSVGRALPGSELRVVDAEGRPLPERVEGEIVLRGPSVMGGYYGDREATDRCLRGGWLHTGDLGFVAEGELFVTGRLKAVLIRAGEKYHAEDLERAAERVDDVRHGCSAAFAVSASGGEDVVIVVERAARSTVDPAQLARRVAEEVLRTEGLTASVVHVAGPGEVPKTSSGKIRREQCHARLLEGSLEILGSHSRAPEVSR